MSTDEIDTFLASESDTGRSMFAPYADDILYMRNVKDATYSKILKWLALDPRNVVGRQSELSKWLKRHEKRRQKKEEAKRAGTSDPSQEQAQTPAARPAPRLPGYTTSPFVYPSTSGPNRVAAPLSVRPVTARPQPKFTLPEPATKDKPYTLSGGDIQMPDGTVLKRPTLSEYGSSKEELDAFDRDQTAYVDASEVAAKNVVNHDSREARNEKQLSKIRLAS